MKYTVEKGQRGCWIIRDPSGNAVHSVNSKAYAVERAAELTAMMERGEQDAPCACHR